MILESISHATSGAEAYSTCSFLEKIRKLNEQRRNGDLSKVYEEWGKKDKQCGEMCENENKKNEQSVENKQCMEDFKKERIKKLRKMNSRSSFSPKFQGKTVGNETVL